jgi:glycosyltransferase involved in cell wall biosynthesis
MKILVVQDTDWLKRNPYQHTHLAERLAQRGHEIRVIDYEILWREAGNKELFSRRQVFHVSQVIKDAKIMVIRPGILKLPVLDYVSMLLTYSKEINRQIQEFMPDIVFGNDILTTYLAYKAAKKNKISTIFYSIDIDYKLIPYKFLQRIGKLIESKNIRNADKVLSINEGLREYTIQMGADPDKTRVIRAGIDSKGFNPAIDGKEIREKYGIGEADTVLFFMGWLYHFSGLKEVALELAKIRAEKANIKLLIVGDGDAFEDLQKLREEHHLDGQIIMTGKQPYERIPEFIAAADVCLLPAYNNEIMRDIVPIKFYEYMAMGKPIIATKLPGVMKEFGNGHGVIYVDKTEDVLKKAIELIENESVVEEGRKARRFVEKNSWDDITDEFEMVLEEIIKVGGVEQ